MLQGTLFKLVRVLLKLLMVIGDMLMTGHCLFLLHGYLFHFAETLASISIFGYITLMLVSYLLHFCNLYRCCLTHNFLVYMCIKYQEMFGFGMYLDLLRLIMSISGIIIICLILKNEFFHECSNFSFSRTLEETSRSN